MRHRGFEPRTTWLKVKCSTNWASIPSSPKRRKCPEPESNQWHADFQSAALPTELSGQKIFTILVAGTGFEPMTFGLWARRASRLLHPAIIINLLKREWAEVDSNHRSKLQQIYSLSPLATRESAHLKRSIWNWLILILKINWEKPMIGLEPITCWLQISCSANWATSAYQMGPIGLEPMTLCL